MKINDTKKAVVGSFYSKEQVKEGHFNHMMGVSYNIKNPIFQLRIVSSSCFFGEPMYYHEDNSENENLRKKTFNYDNSWLIDGTAPIEEIKKHFGWEELENEGSYETLNGFLMYKMKCIPKKAQKIEIKNIVFEIVDVDGYRIDEVMATKKEGLK